MRMEVITLITNRFILAGVVLIVSLGLAKHARYWKKIRNEKGYKEIWNNFSHANPSRNLKFNERKMKEIRIEHKPDGAHYYIGIHEFAFIGSNKGHFYISFFGRPEKWANTFSEAEQIVLNVLSNELPRRITSDTAV